MSQNEKKRTTVEIHNRSYTIVGTEPQHHIRMVASLVDQKMKEIQAANPRLDTTQISVLTAINTMNDYIKLKEECTQLSESTKKDEEMK
ncbi:cell division protein ZapA [Pontibacillus litoralis]|uniref:Cell division protein ZapA n=1 Tax=Pontibacillus litoralis JSM 072002 TaxID=1385512 RepID=A0A0A5GCZ6_9BACI|nr:cell division protein ZapA [Pontibacillus litoralis]KGX89058.1 cell division protein ZapA [Pontibacillus litoralis JSM 072002]